ncbi:MAG: DUF6320 domain-containing protein [Prolixibacteraceae bacterium]|nr:DUF6320 domain-containing protein [Prolixibacteraceae bacterium]
MVKCPNCGVELEENANFCSLCGEPLPGNTIDSLSFIKSGKLRREEKQLRDYQQLTGLQKRKIFWSISGLIFISAIIITLLIDFVGNHHISWSKYPATISLVLFINFTLNTFIHKRLILLLSLSFLSVTALFMLFGVYAGDTGWNLKQGIPIILAAYITVYILILLIKRSRQKGLNIIAYSLLAAGLLSVCTEGVISVFSHNPEPAGWSLVVLVSVAPVSIILLYIHYRLKRATDLKRFFHI